jgi:hypothetical protein
VTAGESLKVMLEQGQAAINAGVVPPGAVPGTLPEGVELDRQPDGAMLLRYGRTMHAGVYAMNWKDEKGKPVAVRFGVNPSTAESELDPISAAQLGELMGNLKVPVQRYDVGGVGLGAPPREMWRPLAMILLGLLLAETAFAVFVGRDR